MSNIKNAPVFKVFDAGQYKVGIAVSKFNSVYTKPMLHEAVKILAEYKVPKENIKIIEVAGSMEIPVALQALAEKGFDCLVAIGIIIKGETAHFEYVAQTITEGVLRVALDYKIPIGFGVITAFNEKQVKTRLHHGREAAVAALHLAKEIKNLS